jgi:hypothetical protein
MICIGNPDKKYFIIYPLNKYLINWVFVVRVSKEKSCCLTDISDWTDQSYSFN